MHRHTFLSAFPLVLFTLTAGTALAQSIEGSATSGATPVITGGHPTKVSLTLRQVAAGQTSPPAAGDTRPLEGTYWRAIELAGKPMPAQDPIREAHLQFQTGRVSGSDGCNRLTGSYQLDGDRVTFGQMAATQMACLNPNGTEAPFRDALKNASRLTVVGDRLELFDAAGTRLAAFQAGSQPPVFWERGD